MKYIIIGNGAAGIAAAEAIRSKDASSDLVIYTDEKRFHYSRPRIVEYLAGSVEAAKLTIRGEEFYTKLNISLRQGTRVESIDPAGRTIRLSGGGLDRFDRLVIAAGASAALPPIEGASLPGVFTLRTVDDADRILAFCEGKRRVLVLGGGLLGIEIAASLAKRGLSPVVVEIFDRLLPRQLDREAAAMLQASLEAKGMTFLLDKRCASIQGGKTGVEARFEDGSSAAADLLIVSAGIRGNLEIPRSAGLACERGIIVNELMETSAPGIYAAGDVAQFQGRVYGLWAAAREQGLVAGANAAGEGVVYRGSQVSARLKVSGIELVSLGSIEAGEGVKVFTSGDEGGFSRLYLKNGKLVGAILIGRVLAAQRLQRLIASGEPAGEPEALLR